jgi:ribonuclease P protein component
VTAGPVRARYLADGSPGVRLAFAIGRSFGNAVARNRARRRIRAAFDGVVADMTHAALVPEGMYLISCSRSVLDITFSELVDSVEQLASRVEAHLGRSPHGDVTPPVTALAGPGGL